jgi:hypothetical protein
VAGKVRQEKCARKITIGKLWQKNCSKKSATEKSRQGIRGSKTAETKLYKKKKEYGFHMCSVEFMNQAKGFPCKCVV